MGLSTLITAATTVGISGLMHGQLAPVARLSERMRSLLYTDDEIMLLVKAFYLSATKMDAREAWHVLDRRKVGSMPRSELLEVLIELLGKPARRQLEQIMDRLPSHRTAIVQSSEQMVAQGEFATLAAEIGAAKLIEDSVGGFIVHELSDMAGDTLAGVSNLTLAWQSVKLGVIVRLPPHLQARAGAVVDRMLRAGYTAEQSSTAIDALYGGRDMRRLARLWGLFDVQRLGHIPVARFDASMLLFTDFLSAADLPAVRIHTCIHTYIHTCIYTYIHIHIYTYMPAVSIRSSRMSIRSSRMGFVSPTNVA